MRTKEYGSDFDSEISEAFLLDDPSTSYFNSARFALFFSGRVALYQLLDQGIKKHGWTEVYLPSFYCHEVYDYLKPLPITISLYDFNPFLDSTDAKVSILDEVTSVVVNVSFFGVVKLPLDYVKKASIIDDFTHNLAAISTSTASYCFGSLRKELPVQVGGFCYSPQGHSLPTGSTSDFSDAVAFVKMTAMYIKGEYLKGITTIKKEDYRKLFAMSESQFEQTTTNSVITPLAKELLFSLDIAKIHLQKKKNLQVALELLKSLPQVFCPDVLGFGLVLYCDDAQQKTDLKSFLIQNSIYPATLWPNQKKVRDSASENRMLFVPLDFRYDEDDARHVASLIKRFFN